MLNVSIRLNIAAFNSYTSSRNTTVKGKLEDAIKLIAQHVDIVSFDADHNAELADLAGTTQLSLPMLSAALYSNENVASRMKRLRTDLDLLEISKRPQEHVPTEEEVELGALHVSTDPPECTCGTSLHYCKLHP